MYKCISLIGLSLHFSYVYIYMYMNVHLSNWLQMNLANVKTKLTRYVCHSDKDDPNCAHIVHTLVHYSMVLCTRMYIIHVHALKFMGWSYVNSILCILYTCIPTYVCIYAYLHFQLPEIGLRPQREHSSLAEFAPVAVLVVQFSPCSFIPHNEAVPTYPTQLQEVHV